MPTLSGPVALLVALLGLTLTACAVAPPAAVNGLPTRVCGTTGDIPTRVADQLCPPSEDDTVASDAGPVRWWRADWRCLDPDDRTDVGAPLDDDYLGEPCDSRQRRPDVAVSKSPWPSTKTPAAPTSKPKAAARTTSRR